MIPTPLAVLHDVVAVLVAWQLLAPAAMLVVVGLPALLGRALSEPMTRRIMVGGFTSAFLAAGGMVVALATNGFAAEVVHIGTLFEVGHHAATIELVADALSVPYVCFSMGLCALVALFAGTYLHREAGFTRFFLLLSLFGMGMNLMVLAGSIDVLFAGWEFLGISSAFLIGFFHERRNAVEAALRAFATYRICDAGLLAASVVIHRAVGSGDFDRLFVGGFPVAVSLVDAPTAAIIVALLMFAALGKSAQLPFSGWLPRAMEGPTPSSAIFYGALSIHAGAYVLLRCGPLLDAAPVVAGLLAVIGGLTAVHAGVVGSVQTDLKSRLAYASMTQAGIIMVEIGLGLRVMPLLHVVSHALLRSLQILRSPSALHDRHDLAAALGGHPGSARWPLGRLLPPTTSRRLYRAALERGFLEPLVGQVVLGPVWRLLETIEDAEARVLAWLGGGRDAAADRERESTGRTP